MSHLRILIAAVLVAAATLVARPAVAAAHEAQPPAAAAPEAAAGEHAAAPQATGAHETEGSGGEHNSGWLAVIAKAFNFAILVGVLVYFLRSPLIDYLNGRITRVREDLVAAAQTREDATRRLSEIHAQLAALPAEIDALRARGAEEIAAEKVRIEQAAEAERRRLLEHTRREIDMRLRIARRDLIEHAATLATEVASARLRASMTTDDQARLLDRYATQIAVGQGRQEARS